jgi:hypothetical protein
MPTYTRANLSLEQAVRYGIVLDHELGAIHAWTFMANNGVERRVILRVLLDAAQRREADRVAVDIAARSGYLHRQAEAIRVISALRLA